MTDTARRKVLEIKTLVVVQELQRMKTKYMDAGGRQEVRVIELLQGLLPIDLETTSKRMDTFLQAVEEIVSRDDCRAYSILALAADIKTLA